MTSLLTTYAVLMKKRAVFFLSLGLLTQQKYLTIHLV